MSPPRTPRGARVSGRRTHASDYEVYAYLQTGQDEAARRIVDSLPEISPRFVQKAVIGGAGGPGRDILR